MGKGDVKPPSSPYTHHHAHKSRAFYSNVGDILNKGLTVPSIEQLAKAPGIRNRVDSRASKISKEVFACTQSDGKAKWRSVSSDAQNNVESFDDVVVRRTSEPTSNLSGNFETPVECHQAEEDSLASPPVTYKPPKSRAMLVQSQVNIPQQHFHFDANLGFKQAPTQQPNSAQSHQHLGHIDHTNFFCNPPLTHKPPMQLFPADSQQFENFTQTSSSSLYPSSTIHQANLAPSDFTAYNIQVVS